MSLVDVLLNSDVDEILAEKTEEYDVERLSKVLGEKFVLTLKSIPAKRYSEIQTTAINIKGKSKNIDLYKMQMLTLNEGIKEPNLADTNLLKKFNATTPFDMYEKLCQVVNDVKTKNIVYMKMQSIIILCIFIIIHLLFSILSCSF